MSDDDQGRGRRYGGPRPGENPEGETFGEAGGYNSGPGESYGGFRGSEAGGATGNPGGGYSGQTGTGWGRAPGGRQGGGGRHEGPANVAADLWGRARQAVSGVFGEDGPLHGPHRGKGPKGYNRSDERIHDDVNDRLTEDPFLDATHVDVSVASGEVTLAGTVTSRQDKRRAEDLAEDVSGVKHVQNNLRVLDPSTTGAA